MAYSILFTIDSEPEATEEQNAQLASYFAFYHKLNEVNGRILYDGTVQDSSTIALLSSAFSSRNPFIIGVWDEQGTPLGMTRIEEWNEETEQYDISYTGTATYSYNEDEYLSLAPNKYHYEEDELINDGKITNPNNSHKFLGWNERYLG